MQAKLEQRSFLLLLIIVTLLFLYLLKPFFGAVFWACAMAGTASMPVAMASVAIVFFISIPFACVGGCTVRPLGEAALARG